MRFVICNPALSFLSGALLALSGAACADSLGVADTTVREAARQVMQEHEIPGMAIAVTVRGEQHFYAFGVASKQTRKAIDRDTLFELGSISKTLTATLATYAAEHGKLSLNDSPSRYLPTLAGTALEPVTLIHLATHTAGGFPLQLPDAIQTEDQLNDYFSAWKPHHRPGTQRTYANPSIGLLGRAAAASLGLSFPNALQKHLLPALGLRSTYLDVPPVQLGRYAQGYNREGEPVRLNPALLAEEAYGLKSSSQDMLHFIEAQLGLADTEPAVSRALAATRVGYYRVGSMTQDLVWEQYAYPAELDVLQAGNGSKMVLEAHPAEIIDPPAQPQADVWINKTGSTNGFGAYLAFIPARQSGVVILANRPYPNEQRVALAYRILQALD